MEYTAKELKKYTDTELTEQVKGHKNYEEMKDTIEPIFEIINKYPNKNNRRESVLNSVLFCLNMAG